jgi:hypothetical protein
MKREVIDHSVPHHHPPQLLARGPARPGAAGAPVNSAARASIGFAASVIKSTRQRAPRAAINFRRRKRFLRARLQRSVNAASSSIVAAPRRGPSADANVLSAAAAACRDHQTIQFRYASASPRRFSATWSRTVLCMSNGAGTCSPSIIRFTKRSTSHRIIRKALSKTGGATAARAFSQRPQAHPAEPASRSCSAPHSA